MALVGVVGVAEGVTLALALAEVAPDGVCVAGAEDGAGWGERALVQAVRTRQAEVAVTSAAVRRGRDGCDTCQTVTSRPGNSEAPCAACRSLIAQQFSGR